MSLRVSGIARGYRRSVEVCDLRRTIARVASAIRHRHHDEGASSLLGILTVVLLLGGIAAFAVTQVPTAGIGTTTTSNGPGGVTQTTSLPSSSVLVAECVYDYATVAAALSDYETLNGAPPRAGTSWATSTTAPGPYVQSWPQGEGRFAIRWNGTSLVVVPARGAASVGSSGATSPPSGCEAL
jgi:hypothetical protein